MKKEHVKSKGVKDRIKQWMLGDGVRVSVLHTPGKHFLHDFIYSFGRGRNLPTKRAKWNCGRLTKDSIIRVVDY